MIKSDGFGCAQACRNGLVQHLENLLFYGADMNAQNASGNTPLHVCAVDNEEACARLLLFRGADRQALNFANQTPYQVLFFFSPPPRRSLCWFTVAWRRSVHRRET